MAWPDVEVIWIKCECWLAVLAMGRGHLEFHIFVRDVLLLIVHSGPTEDRMDDKAAQWNPNHTHLVTLIICPRTNEWLPSAPMHRSNSTCLAASPGTSRTVISPRWKSTVWGLCSKKNRMFGTRSASSTSFSLSSERLMELIVCSGQSNG